MSRALTELPGRQVGRWIPLLRWLRGYDRQWLAADVTAGLTGASVVVPQAMAYAAIAGLPLVTGLYTALVPLVVYAFMGTSRPLSVTTTSTIAILTMGALRDIASNGNSDQLLIASATLAFLVGLALIIASAMRLGVVATLISEPVLVGFKAGVGLTIVVDQIPKFLGIHILKGRFIHNLIEIARHLPQTSVATLVLGLAMLALLLGTLRFFPRVPASLITVVVGIAVSAMFGLSRHGIELVGDVKGGLPSFTLPSIELVDELWTAAIGIALMSFVETAAAGRAFRNPDEPQPEPNQELLAIGLTNIIGSFLQNMPSGGGTSQTAVNREAGARTQIAGLVTASVVAAVLIFLAPVVKLMPQATLAAVVVVPCAAMIQPRAFSVLHRFRAMEYSWAIVSVVGVVLLGTLRGIVVAVVLSLLALVYHSNRRPIFVLARKPGTDVFRPRSSEHPEDESFPGLLILKTEGLVHFANVGRIISEISKLIHEYKPRVLLIDCSAIPDIEYTALHMLTEADRKLREQGVTLWLAALAPEALATIEGSELGKAMGRPRMYFNVEQAVESFQAQEDAEKVGSDGEQELLKP